MGSWQKCDFEVVEPFQVFVTNRKLWGSDPNLALRLSITGQVQLRDPYTCKVIPVTNCLHL